MLIVNTMSNLFLYEIHTYIYMCISHLIVEEQLRKWADLMVIAPLSANSLAKLAHGLCDNLLVRTHSPFIAHIYTHVCMGIKHIYDTIHESPCTHAYEIASACTKTMRTYKNSHEE